MWIWWTWGGVGVIRSVMAPPLNFPNLVWNFPSVEPVSWVYYSNWMLGLWGPDFVAARHSLVRCCCAVEITSPIPEVIAPRTGTVVLYVSYMILSSVLAVPLWGLALSLTIIVIVIIIIIIIIIIMALQPFVGPWPLFQFLDSIHRR
jgi:hypothetical protein